MSRNPHISYVSSLGPCATFRRGDIAEQSANPGTAYARVSVGALVGGAGEMLGRCNPMIVRTHESCAVFFVLMANEKAEWWN